MQHESNSLEFLWGNMHVVHKTRPGAKEWYRNFRTLKIKGPIMGHNIGSDNYIRKRGLQGDWILPQLRKPLELMQCWKRKVKRKTYMNRRMINIQHVPLNDTAQLVKLYRSTGTKGSLIWKKIWWTVKDCLCNKAWANFGSQKVCQMVKSQTYPLYPNTVPEIWDGVQTSKN